PRTGPRRRPRPRKMQLLPGGQGQGGGSGRADGRTARRARPDPGHVPRRPAAGVCAPAQRPGEHHRVSGPVQEGVDAVERVERVRGGTIWTENGPVVGDLVIDQEGRIAALVPDAGRGGGADGGGDAPGSGGGRIIDGTGLWVRAGSGDVDVHFREHVWAAS